MRCIWVLVVLSVLGLAVRWERIHEPMRMDEAANVLYYSDRTWAHTVYSTGGNENHVLNSVLAKVSIAAVGMGEAESRLPVLMAGLALIPAMYWLGLCAGAGEAAALAASAVIAVSPWMIFYSTNGRGYSYQAVLLCLLLGISMRYRQGAIPFSRALPAALAVSAAGTLAARSFIVFTAATALACAWLALRAANDDRARMLRFGAWLAGGYAMSMLVFYLPNLVRYGWAATSSTPRYLRFSLWRAAGKTFWNLLGAAGSPIWPASETIAVSIGAAIVLCALFLIRLERLDVFVAAIAISWIVVSLGSRYIVMMRVLLPAGAIATIWMGAAAARAFEKRGAPAWLPALAVAVLLLGGSRASAAFERIHDSGHLPHARTVAARLLEAAGPGSRVLIDLPPLLDAPVAFYFRAAGRDIKPFHTLGLNRKNDPCQFDTALMWRKGSWAADTMPAGYVAPWTSRAHAAQVVTNGAAGGQIVRYSLKPCPSSE